MVFFTLALRKGFFVMTLIRFSSTLIDSISPALLMISSV